MPLKLFLKVLAHTTVIPRQVSGIHRTALIQKVMVEDGVKIHGGSK